MGQHTREVRARQRASSTGGEEAGLTVLRSESEDASATPDGPRSRSLAGGATNVRLDVWGGGAGLEMATLRHLDLKVSAACDVKIGTTATEAIRVTPRGSQGYLGADLNITRSATVGVWLTNPSATDALTVEFMLS